MILTPLEEFAKYFGFTDTTVIAIGIGVFLAFMWLMRELTAWFNKTTTLKKELKEIKLSLLNIEDQLREISKNKPASPFVHYEAPNLEVKKQAPASDELTVDRLKFFNKDHKLEFKS